MKTVLFPDWIGLPEWVVAMSVGEEEQRVERKLNAVNVYRRT